MIHEFDNSLAEGNLCEKRIQKFIPFIDPYVKSIVYNKDNKMSMCIQKSGIDGYNGRPYDIKCRNYKYFKSQEILLETISSYEDKHLGWLFTLKADVVVYLWQNEPKTKFVGGYLIFLNELRTWLNSEIPEFPLSPIDKINDYNRKNKDVINNLEFIFEPVCAISDRDSRKWTTYSILIPLYKFPNSCLQKIDIKEIFVRFTELSNWFENKEE